MRPFKYRLTHLMKHRAPDLVWYDIYFIHPMVTGLVVPTQHHYVSV